MLGSFSVGLFTASAHVRIDKHILLSKTNEMLYDRSPSTERVRGVYTPETHNQINYLRPSHKI